MTYDQFADELKASGVSGREFARLLGLHPNTTSNYKNLGSVPNQWAAVAVLMRALSDAGLPFRDRLAKLDLKPNAPRGKSIGQS